jgi:hypothetical protein
MPDHSRFVRMSLLTVTCFLCVGVAVSQENAPPSKMKTAEKNAEAVKDLMRVNESRPGQNTEQSGATAADPQQSASSGKQGSEPNGKARPRRPLRNPQ